MALLVPISTLPPATTGELNAKWPIGWDQRMFSFFARSN